MKIFLNISSFIFLINGSFHPIFSYQDINQYTHTYQKNSSRDFYRVLRLANKDNSEKQDFNLKEIPDYSVEKLKNTVKQNKDPFVDTFSKESSSFEDLYIVLLGLFKINDEKTAMFFTNEGIKNYIIGEKIKDYYVIKDIDLISEEVLITDGKEQKFYRFPEK